MLFLRQGSGLVPRLLHGSPVSQALRFRSGNNSILAACSILAHMVNFARLAIVASPTISGQIVAFLAINFTTGPGITGWLMTLLLGIMTFFALEKKRRKHFERFWYSHHLFILFFINWQFHGYVLLPDLNLTIR